MNEDFLQELNSLIYKKKELTYYIESVEKKDIITNFDRFTFENIEELKSNFKKEYLMVLNNELDLLNKEISKFEINKI